MRRHPSLLSWIVSSVVFALLALVLTLDDSQPVMGAQTGPDATPLPLYSLPDPRLAQSVSSSTLGLTGGGSFVIAANMINNTISIAAPLERRLIAEIQVGRDPRNLFVTPDGNRVVVANHGDNTLSVVDIREAVVVATIPVDGVQPYGIVMKDNRIAYVSLRGSDEVVLIDIDSGEILKRIAVPDSPTGLALWGDFLYVTHFWSGSVSLVYLPQGRVVSTMNTGIDTGLAQAIDIDPIRGLAYLPQTRSNAQNPNLGYDTTVFPVVNVLELRGMTLVRQSRITLDTVDRPVNMPFAIAIDRFRQIAYVANAGSNDLSIINLNTGLSAGHVAVGVNPRGVLLNLDNSYVFVHNALEGTLTTIETATQRVVDVLPISNLTIPIDILLGEQLFYSADDTRLNTNQWVSCANCHFDGESDGRTWQGFPDGPRNTPVLFRLNETAPYNWSATWDELADVEVKIRWLQAGLGLLEDDLVSAPFGDPHAGRSDDLDTLAAYIVSLQPPQNPIEFDAAMVERGAEIFAQQGCSTCHVGDVGTNLQQFDVGTGDALLETLSGDLTFDTPSLRWLWMSAPYYHDGSAQNLYEVFTRSGTHQLTRTVISQDIDALVTYLLSLPIDE